MTEESAVLYVVATPIGHLADLTERARQMLCTVPWVAAEDTRHSQPLLRHLGSSARLLPAHQHNEEAAAQQIIAKLTAGEAVALISDAGTPAVSDPGARIVARVRAAGFRVVPLPGACAAAAALSASGLDAPHFLFYGFLPAKGGQRDSALLSMLDLPYTLIFYEAPHRIVDTVDALLAVFGPDRTLVIARELTKMFETIHACPLAEAPAWLAADSNQQRGEFVLLLSGAPAAASDDLPADSDRVLGLLLAADLPLKQVARLAAHILHAPKNALYERALALKQAAG